MPYNDYIETPTANKLNDKRQAAQILRSEIARLTEELQAAERDIAALEERERVLLEEKNELYRDRYLPYGAELAEINEKLTRLHDTLERQKQTNTGTELTERRIAEQEARLAAILEEVKHG